MKKPTILILLVVLALSIFSCVEQKKVEKKYEANWESLQAWECPEWFKDAKFGIFIHWGPYCVPEFGSEWYPRHMYMDSVQWNHTNGKVNKDEPHPVYKFHKENFGDPSEFCYKDFIPMFTGEKFDADEWIALFREAGAKYVVPVAEHHDGFAMYKSSHTRWNAADMGPKKDILGELKKASEKEGLKFGASSHFAFNWNYYNQKKGFDTGDPQYADLYADQHEAYTMPTQAFKDLWWKRTTEIIDNYQPDVLWFDFYWDRKEFADYHPKMAAYYYNKALEWGKEVGLQNKNLRYDSFPKGTFIEDIERGTSADIREDIWQTDTSVGANSWGYVKNWISKTPNDLIDDLIDIVSKNGCMLLNVGPKKDGTIPQDQQDVLKAMGAWLKVNGEAIFGTRPWKISSEGPTVVKDGYMAEKKGRKVFVAEDIRFTQKDGVLYATALGWPESGEVNIKSLKDDAAKIKSLTMLGSDDKLEWKATDDALQIKLPAQKPHEYAYVFKIEM